MSKKTFCWHLESHKSRIRIRIQIHNLVCGSKDPDPSQNVKELEVGTLIYYSSVSNLQITVFNIVQNKHGQDLGGLELR